MFMQFQRVHNLQATANFVLPRRSGSHFCAYAISIGFTLRQCASLVIECYKLWLLPYE